MVRCTANTLRVRTSRGADLATIRPFASTAHPLSAASNASVVGWCVRATPLMLMDIAVALRAPICTYRTSGGNTGSPYRCARCARA